MSKAAAMPAATARARGRSVGLLGLGRSGRAMAAYLLRRGVAVWAVEEGAADPDAELVALGLQRCDGVQLAARLLPGPGQLVGLVLSPGVDPEWHPLARGARAAGLPLWGELSLCGPLPCVSVGITGTNGKSTTSALCGALLCATGWPAFVGGNFGPPLVEFLDAGAPAAVAVLELSSYQLQSPFSFAPDVAVLLNLSPDHLARHGSMAAYGGAKARLLAALQPGGRAILNAADPAVVTLAPAARAPIWWFDAAGEPLPGAGLRLGTDGRLQAQGDADLAPLDGLRLEHPHLLGAHNRQNALAACLAVVAVARQAKKPLHVAALRAASRNFVGLPHRLQYAGRVAGVDYYNDSKATNDAAAAIAIAAMQRPFVLLLGGRAKGGGFAAVCAALARAPLKQVICFGEAASLLLAELQAVRPALPVVVARPGATALPLSQAQAAAAPGDVVLLSPACASFDSFVDYEARGAALLAWVAAQTAPFTAPPANESESR